jgi:hypothetical protein
MDWLVRRGSGKLLVITNNTGSTVTDVKMQLRGHAVGGMFGDPNWSWTSAELAHGGGIETVFGAAWGAAADPPRIEVTWTAADGKPRHQILDDLPL